MSEYRIAEGKELRIAISGKSGCGNTTVSTLLSSVLRVKLINYTFRQLALEKGMTLAQVIENAKTDDSYDRFVDNHQVELARKENCVLGSRLAVWMLKEADLKVYLLASDDVRAGRIFNREGGDIEEIKKFTAMRDSEDSKRYKALYSIDNTDTSGVDLIIDTADKNPSQIVELILSELENKGLIQKVGRKSFGVQTMMYPMPVLMIATYDEKGNADIMNAAWGGIHNTNQIGICISHEHKTGDNLLAKKEFTVSMADAFHVTACDYLGVVSAKDEPNKVQKSGLTVSKAPNVDAPMINELPLCLECRMVSYDEESDYMYADIVNVSCSESCLNKDGKIDITKVKPITFDSVTHGYYEIGEKVGQAFKDGLKLK